MSKWDIFMMVLQLIAIGSTAINFWCIYRVPMLRRALKFQSEAFGRLAHQNEELILRCRKLSDEGVRLQHMLNGRR